MSILRIAPSLIILSILGHAYAPAQAQTTHSVPLVADSIRIDGVFDEPAWKIADSLSLTLNNNPAGGKPKSATSVKVTWNQANLFVAFTVESKNVEGTITQHDGPLYEQDVVEMFIDPDGDSQNYLELEWNCLNTSLDFRYAGVRTGMDEAWKPKGMRSAVKVQGTANKSSDIDTGMTLEVAIPWSDIQEWSKAAMPPKVGEKLKVNFYRIDYPSEELMAWAPTGVADFHKPDKFGQLLFAGATSRIVGPRARRTSAGEAGPGHGALKRVTPDGRAVRKVTGPSRGPSEYRTRVGTLLVP